MPSTDEDRRAAVALSTSLSGQLVQAAVTMLTVEGAYIAYALVARDTSAHFNLVALISALTFVISVFLSGKGITKARNAGFEGNWSLNAGKSHFNLQAISLIVALGLFGWMLFLSGTPKDSDTHQQLVKLNAELARLQTDAARQSSRLQDELNSLALANRQLKAQLDVLQRAGTQAKTPAKRSAP